MADRKLEVESRFICPRCKGNPYTLYRRQVTPGSLVFEHVVWPGSDGLLPPPEDSKNLKCPNCDEILVRG